MPMVTAIACTVTIATASKTKHSKTSRLHHEVWRKQRRLVKEDGVGTIMSEIAGDVAEQLDIDRGLAGLLNSNAALLLQSAQHCWNEPKRTRAASIKLP